MIFHLKKKTDLYNNLYNEKIDFYQSNPISLIKIYFQRKNSYKIKLLFFGNK